jgi:hypothetical protein
VVSISTTRLTPSASGLAQAVPAWNIRLAQRNDEIRSFAGFARRDALIGDDDRAAGREVSVMRAIASAGIVRRSSASAGLSGSGAACDLGGARDLAAAGSPLVVVAPLGAAGSTASVTTDQRRTLASFLSASAVKMWVPSGRSLGAMVTGTSNSGAKFCRT